VLGTDRMSISSKAVRSAIKRKIYRLSALFEITGIHVKRDNRRSIAYSEELIFPMAATLQSTDRHYGIVGQEYCHFQRDS